MNQPPSEMAALDLLVSTYKLPFIRSVIQKLDDLKQGEEMILEGVKFQEQVTNVCKWTIQFSPLKGKKFIFDNDFKRIKIAK